MRFLPAIIRDDSQYPFPRPVISCRLHDNWDYLKLKVPRQDGEQVAGVSRDGVMISIEGQFGAVDGELTLSEAEMLDAAESLRNALHETNDNGYELALFQDDFGERRSFRNCLTSRFEIDFSNPSLFTYAVSIHAADPKLYGADLE